MILAMFMCIFGFLTYLNYSGTAFLDLSGNRTEMAREANSTPANI
jgi:hypothetical protein